MNETKYVSYTTIPSQYKIHAVTYEACLKWDFEYDKRYFYCQYKLQSAYTFTDLRHDNTVSYVKGHVTPFV